MKLKVYPLLSTRSKRAFIRVNKKYGRPYRYEPRYDLIQRLKTELSMSEAEVLEQVREERSWLIKHRRYYL